MKLETKSDEPGNAILRQLWKIRYLGGGYYGIRALYKPDRCLKVTSNAAKLHVVDTFDHISYFDDNALWKIEALGTGYTLQNCGVTTSKQCLRPSGTDVVTSTFVSGNGAFTWTLTPNTIVPDLLILLDKDTARPINGSFHTLYEGETATLDDLNLMVSYVSQTKNEVDYYWQSSNSSVAYVNANDEIVVCGRGETTISLHVSSSTNTPMYLIIHSPYVDDGTYYIRNWETDRYIELTDSGRIYGEQFSHSSSQLWDITYLGNREYSIRSHQSTSQYLAINGNSSAQEALVVPRTGNLTTGMKWTFTKADIGTFRISAQCAPDLYIRTSVYVDREIRQVAPENSGSQYSEWLFCEYSNQIEHEKQVTENGCWVTCARMASNKYMKTPINQATAAYYGYYPNFPTRTMYSELEAGTDPLEGGDHAYTRQALEFILGWDGCAYSDQDAIYSEETLISLLNAGNVVIAGRKHWSGTTHAYLVYDYSYNSTLNRYQFHIFDPWNDGDNSTIIRTYAWLCNGDNGYYSNHRDGRIWTWIVTYRIGDYDDTLTVS